jgi:hypothetical protein
MRAFIFVPQLLNFAETQIERQKTFYCVQTAKGSTKSKGVSSCFFWISASETSTGRIPTRLCVIAVDSAVFSQIAVWEAVLQNREFQYGF